MTTNLAYNKNKNIFDVIVWKVDGSMLYKTFQSGFWKEEEFIYLSIEQSERLYKFKNKYPHFNLLIPNEASLNYILFN